MHQVRITDLWYICFLIKLKYELDKIKVQFEESWIELTILTIIRIIEEIIEEKYIYKNIYLVCERNHIVYYFIDVT